MKQKNFYQELDKRIQDYEKGPTNRSADLYQIAYKIDWCWKFKKITEKQMNELCDRVTNIFENKILV